MPTLRRQEPHSKFSKDAIYISVSYISRISTCTSTKTPENDNISEITLIKAKCYTEEFQALFWSLSQACNDNVHKSNDFLVP